MRDGFNFHAMLPSVELEEFEDLELLGRGASAIVVSATHKRTRQTVAIRLILARKLLSPDYLFRELDVHRQISHPFIADFFGILTTDEYFVYCLELVENGSLLDKINATKGISEVEANKYFCQLMSAIRLLHEGLSVAHRDIKLENLLIDSRGNLKMIDFGFVSEQSKILRSVCGSAPYTAPEIIKGEAYTHQVDLWSAGVCLYGMFTGNLPFRPMHGKDLGRVIMEDEPEYPDVIPANAKDLIKGLLEKDPEKRMTMDGVRCHPWIRESKYSTYISDDYLNLVTSTDAFDGSVLDGYPDIDPDSVERMIEVGAPDTDDSVTYRILKHVAKVRMPAAAGGRSRRRSGAVSHPAMISKRSGYEASSGMCIWRPARPRPQMPTLIFCFNFNSMADDGSGSPGAMFPDEPMILYHIRCKIPCRKATMICTKGILSQDFP